MTLSPRCSALAAHAAAAADAHLQAQNAGAGPGRDAGAQQPGGCGPPSRLLLHRHLQPARPQRAGALRFPLGTWPLAFPAWMTPGTAAYSDALLHGRATLALALVQMVNTTHGSLGAHSVRLHDQQTVVAADVKPSSQLPRVQVRVFSSFAVKGKNSPNTLTPSGLLARAILASSMWVTFSTFLKPLVKCAHLELPYPQGRRLGAVQGRLSPVSTSRQQAHTCIDQHAPCTCSPGQAGKKLKIWTPRQSPA